MITEDRWSNTFATMGQKTGVDGNYMSPKLFYTTVSGANINHWVGNANFKWTDTVDQSAYPSAQSRIKVPVELPADVAQTVVVALQGIDVALSCDDLKQPANTPCNSQGAWPTNFRVALVECESPRFGSGSNNPSCYLSVDFDRAWTPGKGGVQFGPFNEIKDINHRIDFDINVKLGIYAANNAWNLLVRQENVKAWKKTLQTTMTVDKVPVNNLLVGPKSATVITGMSFKLSKPEYINPIYLAANLDPGHMGRYLGRLAFNTTNPSGGIFDKAYNLQAGVWSPISVMDAVVNSSLSTRFIGFPSANSVNSGVVTGSLCNNSTDQAPWFSV
jgi:hypothetical protein